MKSSWSQGTSPLALAGMPSRAQPGLGAHGATHFIHPAACLPSAVPAFSALGRRTALSSWRPDCRAGTRGQHIAPRQPCVSVAPSCFLLGSGSGFALELKSCLRSQTGISVGRVPSTSGRPVDGCCGLSPALCQQPCQGYWGCLSGRLGRETARAGHLHVTRQDSAGEATCGLPSSHLHGPTSC